MPNFDPKKVLFVGMGANAVCWYRVAMPATFMGADWVGLAERGGRDKQGDKLDVAMVTGLVKGETRFPAFDEYDLVVLQQPYGRKWLKIIDRLKQSGVKVVYEIDDYVHGIRKMGDHDFRKFFEKEHLKDMELCMRPVDAMICSTGYIARRYRTFNKRAFVCENAIDTGRYNLTRPPRPSVNLLWAGATGHIKAAIPWFQQVDKVMSARDDVCCVTVGENFADGLKPRWGSRAIAIPWTLIDIYPAAMTMGDVALAPAGKGAFFQGKSDLRWLEAGALGMPIIADPAVYPKIEHGVTGFHAADPAEAGRLMLELVDDRELRTEVGANAYEYVRGHRDMRFAVGQWAQVFEELLA